MIEPFKYILQPVAVEWDETHGRIVRELPGQPLTVYNAAQAAQAITEFEAQLEKLSEEGAQDEPDQQDNGRAQADLAERPPAGGVRQP